MSPVLRLLWLARPAWPRLGLATIAGTGAAGAAVGLAATSAWLISRAAQRPPVLYLMVAIVAVRAFGLSRGVLRYTERLVGHDAALRVLARLRTECYARLVRLSPAGTPDLHGGDLVSRFTGDVDAGVDVLVRVVLPYTVATLVGAGSVALLAALVPAAGAALLAGLLAVGVGVPALHHALARRADRRTAPLRGELAAGTVDLLHGLPDLLAHGAAGPMLATLTDTDARLRRATDRAAATTGLGGALVSVAAGACVWAGLALGTPAVRAGQLPGVLLAVLVLSPLAVFEAVAGLPTAAPQLATARGALARVFAVLDRPPVPEPATPAALPQLPAELRLDNVSARWRPDGPDVLHDVNLTIRPGQRIAVIGPSGSGKSTLAALLVRFLDPSAGRITLGGVDLCELLTDAVRRVIGLAGDDAYLFDSDIAANLRVGRPDATDADLYRVLDAVRLRSFVDGLPLGLGTAVGEHGARLSGGQRRRLSVARALLADFPILVLDEPTEHLDEPTAAALTADLLDATRGRTVVLITHRTHGLSAVDGPFALGNQATDESRRPS
jgi:ATP-binding cassette, subfamily C, bacterial CydC